MRIFLPLALLCAAFAPGAIFSGGDLVANTANGGGINSIKFRGTEFFAWGTPVGNLALGQGSNFGVNTGYGSVGLPYWGTNFGGTENIYFLPGTSITIQPNQPNMQPSTPFFSGNNAMILSPTISNESYTTTQSVMFALSMDPDQDYPFSFATHNETGHVLGAIGNLQYSVVYALAQGPVSGKTVIMATYGSSPGREVRAAAGDPFQIDTPASLQSTFNNPHNGNGQLVDGSLHIVMQLNIPPRTGFGTSIALFFGDTRSEALDSFNRFYQVTGPYQDSSVPEPATWSAGFVLAALAIRSRFKK